MRAKGFREVALDQDFWSRDMKVSAYTPLKGLRTRRVYWLEKVISPT